MPASPTSQERATDRPLADPLLDDFQRASFAKRLAETLLAPSHTASIVVGLYGKWGEGKSTVLNFIEYQLRASSPAPVILHLNPWRFPDESQLLLDFFKQLTSALGQNLHNTGEKIAEAVTKYIAPLIPKIGYGGIVSDPASTLQAIGNIAQPGLDELHRRVDQVIVDSGKRVVVFIDDIDRLEKTQIQSVFRLVKLTANFRQTSYLLAFDDVMVARAIGDIFAAGADATSSDTLSAGQNFLEKIVQVPLRLPHARQQDLWQYCHARVQEALIDTQTELDGDEARRTGQAVNTQRYYDALRRGILPRLTTPRLAIRYANAIRFSLPLLRGEVNTVDQLLIEVLNIFYPELHQFVAAHQDDFAGSGEARKVIKLHDGDDEPELDAQLDTLFQKYSYKSEAAAGAKSLLTALFPRLATKANIWAGWENLRNRVDEAELSRQKSVAAPAYFSRYFSYSVARGDVSDHEFDAMIDSAGPTQLAHLRDFAQRLGPAITLERVAYRIPDVTEAQGRSLLVTIQQAADLYQPDRNWDGVGTSEISQAARLLIQLLPTLSDISEREEVACQLIREGANFKLAYEFDQQLQKRYKAEKRTGDFDEASSITPLFTADIWEKLLSTTPQLLLERALREANVDPLYRTHPERAFKLLASIWPGLDIPPGPVDYLFSFLDQRPTEVNDFLEVCSQRASIGNGPYQWVGLHPEMFDSLREVFGERLYNMVRGQFGDGVVRGVDFDEFDTPTPRQRLQQFIWLYENRPMPVPQAE
jgi:predicted KAP-like P-loop ATPase